MKTTVVFDDDFPIIDIMRLAAARGRRLVFRPDGTLSTSVSDSVPPPAECPICAGTERVTICEYTGTGPSATEQDAPCPMCNRAEAAAR